MFFLPSKKNESLSLASLHKPTRPLHPRAEMRAFTSVLLVATLFAGVADARSLSQVRVRTAHHRDPAHSSDPTRSFRFFSPLLFMDNQLVVGA